MSSKLNSGVHYAYMRGGTAWVKSDMVLLAGNTVWSMPERIRGVCEDTLNDAIQINVTITFTTANKIFLLLSLFLRSHFCYNMLNYRYGHRHLFTVQTVHWQIAD